MNSSWLLHRSWLSEEDVRKRLKESGWSHFEGGSFFTPISDIYAELCPSSRKIFWEEVQCFPATNPNERLTDIKAKIDARLKEYPDLPTNTKEAGQIVFKELADLNKRLYPDENTGIDEKDELDVIYLNDELSWILGQIINSFPETIPLLAEEKYEGFEMPFDCDKILNEAYDTVEFLIMLLEDRDIKDYFIEHRFIFKDLMSNIIQKHGK